MHNNVETLASFCAAEADAILEIWKEDEKGAAIVGHVQPYDIRA